MAPQPKTTTAPPTPPTPLASAYLQTKVLTARPEELRLMLLDGAIKFARQGRDGLARRDFEATFNGLSRARNIVLELLNSIRPDPNPELAGRMTSLYTFLYTELLNASVEKSIERVDNVVSLLEYERETWVMLMEKLASERTAAAAPAEPVPSHERVPLSIQG